MTDYWYYPGSETERVPPELVPVDTAEEPDWPDDDAEELPAWMEEGTDAE